ncbi:MAG TPA: lactonase family protein [Chloroflexota bacterium]|nr:lactonase family protein [Chloroflexota bacterium]
MYAYVGCYTTADRDGRGKGIEVFEMDPDSGAWTHVQRVEDVVNPSWLTLDARQEHLYSVHGGNDFTAVSAFSRDSASGKLTKLNSQDCGSANPVAISILPNMPFAVVAGYYAGKVSAIRLNPDGSLGSVSDVVTLLGTPGPRAGQESSHPHHIPVDPAGNYFIVPDKGHDRTYVFRVEPTNGKIIPSAQGSIIAAPGSAPRHLAFHPSAPFAYQCNELSSTVTTFAYDTATGQLDELEAQTTLPKHFSELNTTAEIQIAPSGKFVYVSNRGHNTIAIFKVNAATGKLSSVGWEPTQGKQPRYFGLSPDGSLLYTANQASDTIVTFRVDGESGTLAPTGQIVETGSPVSIVFAGT